MMLDNIYLTREEVMDQSNPYAASTVALDTPAGQQVLADRGARLIAVLIDGFAVLACMLPFGLAFLVGDGTGAVAGIAGALSGLAVLGLVIYQLMMLHRQGQTIGKRAMKVRIVRTDGSHCGIGRLIALRWLVPALIGAIPLVGGLFSLLDPLMIFRENRLCLHDNIADTKVVQA